VLQLGSWLKFLMAINLFNTSWILLEVGSLVKNSLVGEYSLGIDMQSVVFKC
jgi:hypothetical protein